MSPEQKNKPLLNPALRLLTQHKPTPATGRDKSQKHIDSNRLAENITKLPNELERVKKSCTPEKVHAGKVILFAELYPDRLKPTLTPDDLFNPKNTSTELITSTDNGYLIESPFLSLELLKETITSTANIKHQVDICSIKSFSNFDSDRLWNKEDLDKIWKYSQEITIEGNCFKSFSLWLMPYKSMDARESVATSFWQATMKLIDGNLGTQAVNKGCWSTSSFKGDQLQLIKLKLRDYLAGNHPRVPIKIKNRKQLTNLITSGTVCRIDPIASPAPSIPPGEGKEPAPPTPEISSSPIVAIVDGGLTAKSYQVAIAWDAPPYIPTHLAAREHGNQVASLLIDATGWNNNLNIPDLPCRVAPIQAVPAPDVHNIPFEEDTLFEYLDELMQSHPETKVWNFSANLPFECDEHQVSSLADGLRKLARKHKILPVISAGNIFNGDIKISPPADCESAVVVSGRKYNNKGQLKLDYCDISRRGLGPHGALKPDISSFSTVRVLGGKEVTGTSYSTPLISRIAAHTFNSLKYPSPDAVRAILLNSTDLTKHDDRLGWGSPILNEKPWLCPEGVVTLVWDSELETGQNYYWNDIYVPPSMLDNEKLKGEISLCAILDPQINETPYGQYYLSRLEANIQALDNNGKYYGLLGSCSTNGTCNTDGPKWNPIRVHRAKFPSGKMCIGGKLRMRARIYLRDKFGIETKIGEDKIGTIARVSFALSLTCIDNDNKHLIYDEFRQLMKTKVESAVIEQEVEISS